MCHRLLYGTGSSANCATPRRTNLISLFCFFTYSLHILLICSFNGVGGGLLLIDP